jgi:PAS domain S-box-containing protein
MEGLRVVRGNPGGGDQGVGASEDLVREHPEERRLRQILSAARGVLALLVFGVLALAISTFVGASFEAGRQTEGLETLSVLRDVIADARKAESAGLRVLLTSSEEDRGGFQTAVGAFETHLVMLTRIARDHPELGPEMLRLAPLLRAVRQALEPATLAMPGTGHSARDVANRSTALTQPIDALVRELDDTALRAQEFNREHGQAAGRAELYGRLLVAGLIMIGVLLAGLGVASRRAESRAMAHRLQRLRAIGDGLPHLLWLCDAHGRPTFFNRLFEDYCGLSDAALRDSAAWRQFVEPAGLALLRERWTDAISLQQPFEARLRVRDAQHRWRWFMLRARPLVQGGQLIRWLGTLTDVDDLLRIQQQLRDAESTLREEQRRKDAFIATLAHELRNPLGAVANAAALVRRITRLEDRERPCAIMERQLGQMSHLLDDLMDCSRIGHGQLSLAMAPCNLRDVLQRSIEAIRPLIDKRGHSLEATLPDAGLPMHGDPARLQQVFTNLLANAVRYTPEGGTIRLVAETTPQHAVVQVADTGIGMAPESLERLFQPFTQVHALDPGTPQAGLGIGLALVRGLVELHGGRVEAFSAGLGRGSVFTVVLPRPESFPLD